MDPKVIGPQDTQLLLAAAATVTASGNGTAIDLGAGFAPGAGGIPMQAIIEASATKLSAANETYSFKLQDSVDNATWIDRSPPVTAANEGITVDGTGGTILVGAFIRQRYVRLVETLGGTAPSVVLSDIYLQPQVNSVG
jgi:hypothetical protein